MKILDYIFVENCRNCGVTIAPGKSPARTLCRNCWLLLCEEKTGLHCCKLQGFGAITVSHAVAYQEITKALIYKLKYDGDRLIAADLSILLQQAYESLPDRSDYESSPPTLVPIPLSRFRELKRGFNQSELFCRYLSRQTGLRVDNRIIMRVRHTKAQHELSKAERILNVRNAFRSRTKSPQKNIILVDDIHTSGATLSEAARALLEAGAENIAAITVARALYH